MLLLLLFLAVLADLKTDRIPNELILVGIVSGVSGNLWIHCDIRQTVFSMLLAFVLLYPLFKIGTLGAGDVKVFIMTGSFLEIQGFLNVLAAAFVIGALLSLAKLLIEHNGRERIGYLLSYVLKVARTRQWEMYDGDMVQGVQQYRRNKIHFTIPILFGAVIQIGGVV